MQTIETMFRSRTNVPGSCIIAITSGAGDEFCFVESETETNDSRSHRTAAKELATRMGWQGEFLGGDTDRGMVWVMRTMSKFWVIPQMSEREPESADRGIDGGSASRIS